MPRTIGPLLRNLLVPMLLAAVSLMASGCLWGVVTDSTTGAPLRNVPVTYVDSAGQTLTATTNEFGVYSFTAPRPAGGNANVSVNAAGYEPWTEARLLEYNEPGFNEVQNISMAPPANRQTNTEGLFSVTFPWEWEVATEGPITIGFSYPTSPDFPSLCAAMSVEIVGELDIDLMIMLSLNAFRSDVHELREIERSPAVLDMGEATRVLIGYKAEVDREEVGFRDLAYFLVRANRLFILECSTISAKFPGRKLTFEDIAAGFRTY